MHTCSEDRCDPSLDLYDGYEGNCKSKLCKQIKTLSKKESIIVVSLCTKPKCWGFCYHKETLMNVGR